jgi:hypothetical protein
MADENADMRERSGRVVYVDPLIGLFYDLLRDHIQPGDLEKLVQQACAPEAAVIEYTNGWLARYAEDMVRRLDKARNAGAETEAVLSK